MLREGDRVKVFLPPVDIAVTKQMRQYHGLETTIEKVVSAQFKKNGPVKTYRLEGCVSEMGVPFTFMAEWLIPLDCEVTA